MLKNYLLKINKTVIILLFSLISTFSFAIEDGVYKIYSQYSGKKLTTAFSTHNVFQASNQDPKLEYWKITQINNAFQIKNIATGECLHITGASKSDGANVQRWACNSDSPSQRFRIDLKDDGSVFAIINLNSNKAVDVSWADGRMSKLDGQNIHQWTYLRAINQKWIFKKNSAIADPKPTSCKLRWSDEFNYTGLPMSLTWSFDSFKPGSVNAEWQNYTNQRLENARVQDGKLIIESRRDDYQNYTYSSARISTKYKKDWLYGKLEVRAKLPKGRGTWPAIWMLPTNNSYGNWPKSGEIDVMEYVGYQPNRIYSTIHTEYYNHTRNTQIGIQFFEDSVEEEFHTYTIDWYPDRLDFYVDNIKTFIYRKNDQGSGGWPFDKSFYLILNMAIGGTWGGVEGVDENIFPARMEVDYVRLYEQCRS